VSATQAGTAANTTETDLWTYSLPANALSADAKGLRITVYYQTAANANTKTTKLYFGSTVLASRAAADSGANGQFVGEVLRTGASAQAGFVESKINTSVFATTYTTPAEATSGAISIKVTGQNGTASANDVVFKAAIVETLY
jgi:hypothetical protein